MTAHFKTLVQALMVMLTLGIWLPDSLCATTIPSPKMECCCHPGATCACQPTDACGSTCIATEASTSDKGGPIQTSLTSTPRVNVALFALADSSPHPISNAAYSHRESAAPPPYGGSPPQALLRLWLL